ncbi:hypothetical protein JTE90_022020 [Oedothorax gibbosus]|uniref:Fanconi Anaemia group E protein C-terminal domain-containing protein n=1 Tax=Oedothorax gibbosus TaxID=931172 RepID=A0AAV6V3B4_9ARAC|nr:hypothetical protein JTE90_022020 [Oedothorax gibbosus]
MSEDKNNTFEISENEEIFKEICKKLKKHPFKSPWGMCFEVPEEGNISYEVQEITIPELDDRNPTALTSKVERKDNPFPVPLSVERGSEDSCNEIDTINLSELKNSLMGLQENSTIENIHGIGILHSLSLSQVPKLCTMLSDINMSLAATTLFLNAVLTFEMPLSLSLSNALIKSIVYSQVFESKTKYHGSRNLLAAVLSFSEIYPKAAIDEIIVPCIQKQSLEPFQLETLLKMTKSSLPKEYISYCIRNILEYAIATEHIFTFLQNLVEHKIHLEIELHDKLAWKIEMWTTTHNKNIKFTKLIISILTVYGNELRVKQLAIYHETIQSNETIMKKAAENAMKKINI